MKNNHKITIESKKLLLVEGKDEENFFTSFLKKTDISGIQIIPCGGRDQLKHKLPPIIKTPNFKTVKSLGVIQDADDSAPSALNRVCDTLKQHKFNPPDKHGEFKEDKEKNLKTGIFIMPDGQNPGMLESLCLFSVKDEKINRCINSFMACVNNPLNENSSPYKKPKNTDKARLRAFLAAMEEDCSSLGIAAQKSYWDFKSPEFKPLLNFLQNI